MIKAKLIIDGLEINVLWFSFGYEKQADANGRPTTKTTFLGIKLVIETRRDLNLADWASAKNQTKQLELHIYPVIMGGKTRKLYFYDCHLLNWDNYFSSTGDQPMSETLTISAGGVKDDTFLTEYSASWRTTFPNNDITPYTREESKNPEIIDFYYIDKGKNKDTKLTYGDEAYLVLESKDMIGEIVDLKLNKKIIDFMYEGQRLENNVIKEYQIRTDKDKIAVTVIEEDNEDL